MGCLAIRMDGREESGRQWRLRCVVGGHKKIAMREKRRDSNHKRSLRMKYRRMSRRESERG